MHTTPTSDPNVVRLSFLVQDKPRVQMEAVVYARVIDNGDIELHYSHQVIHERPIDDGPWDKNSTIVRVPLTRALSEQIKVGAMMALFESHFPGELKILEIDPGNDPTVFQWGRGGRI